MADHSAVPGPENLGAVVTNPVARQVIYGGYVVALLVLGGISVGEAAIGATLPHWLVAANAMLGYLGIPIGGLAIVNTPKGT